jgi:hypothetical protein
MKNERSFPSYFPNLFLYVLLMVVTIIFFKIFEISVIFFESIPEFILIGIFFTGLIIIGGGGLTLVKRSRFIGILLIISSILFVISTANFKIEFLEYYFVFGLIIGLVITGYFIYKGFFNKLAFVIRNSLGFILICLIFYEFLLIFSNELGLWTIGIILVFDILLLMLFAFFFNNLYSINSRDSVIIGPKGSGRSHLLALLALEYMKNYYGRGDISIPVLLSGDIYDRRFNVTELIHNFNHFRPVEKGEFVIYKILIKGIFFDRNIWLIVHDSDFMTELAFLEAINIISRIALCSRDVVKNVLDDVDLFRNFISECQNGLGIEYDVLLSGLIQSAFEYNLCKKAGKIILLTSDTVLRENDAMIYVDHEDYYNTVTKFIANYYKQTEFKFVFTEFKSILADFSENPQDLSYIKIKIKNFHNRPYLWKQLWPFVQFEEMSISEFYRYLMT